MKTVKEYLTNLRPGDEFLILDLMKALDTDSLTEECQILEDLQRVEGSILYLRSGSYRRMYASTDPFIKQIKEKYKANGKLDIKDFVGCWLRYIPKGSEFRVDDVAAFCPITLAEKAIARYLNEYAKEGIVEKHGKNPILYKRVKSLEPKKRYNAIQQRFINFLKREGLLECFSKYVEKSDYMAVKLNLEKLITGEGISIVPECWISGTFRWSNTKEGYAFWQKTNIKWLIDLISSIKSDTGEALAGMLEYTRPEAFLDLLKQMSEGLRAKYGLDDWKEMIEEED